MNQAVPPPPIVPFVATMTLEYAAERLKVEEAKKSVYIPRQDALAELRDHVDWTITVIETRMKRKDIPSAEAKERIKKLKQCRAEINTQLQQIAQPINRCQEAINAAMRFETLIEQLRSFEPIPEVMDLPPVEMFAVPVPPEPLEVKRPPRDEQDSEDDEESEEVVLP